MYKLEMIKGNFKHAYLFVNFNTAQKSLKHSNISSAMQQPHI